MTYLSEKGCKSPKRTKPVATGDIKARSRAGLSLPLSLERCMKFLDIAADGRTRM